MQFIETKVNQTSRCVLTEPIHCVTAVTLRALFQAYVCQSL